MSKISVLPALWTTLRRYSPFHSLRCVFSSQEYECEVHASAVGEIFVAEKMLAVNAIIGGNSYIHFWAFFLFIMEVRGTVVSCCLIFTLGGMPQLPPALPCHSWLLRRYCLFSLVSIADSSIRNHCRKSVLPSHLILLPKKKPRSLSFLSMSMPYLYPVLTAINPSCSVFGRVESEVGCAWCHCHNG